jgi:hypothetical protein
MRYINVHGLSVFPLFQCDERLMTAEAQGRLAQLPQKRLSVAAFS